MLCQYSTSVWSILILMIVTGAARSVVVKLAYQNGFEVPLTVSILYLLGQAMSLVVFFLQKKIRVKASRRETMRSISSASTKESEIESGEESDDKHNEEAEISNYKADKERVDCFQGSLHGLSKLSFERTNWIHSIPWYAKPAIPGFFNLLNSTLRWFALIFIPASISEMLISGLELALSVIAARIIRKRLVSVTRWKGVLIIIVGIILIGYVNYHRSSLSVSTEEIENLIAKNYTTIDTEGNIKRTTASSRPNAAVIGNILVFLQCILSVLQDITEEIFMQAADFPPLLLLGMEGMFGLVFGIILFFAFGKYLGEDPMITLRLLDENPIMFRWVVVLPFLFLLTSIFNIKATEVTSSMTRNIWKNFRTILVWVISLLIFYTTGDPNIGEEWWIPESFYLLFGFCIIFVGVAVYYWQKQKEDEIRKQEKGKE